MFEESAWKDFGVPWSNSERAFQGVVAEQNVSRLSSKRQNMKTVSMREQDVVRSWWIIDAEDKTLGRIATEVASRLRGKHKPEFTPHVDTGDYIVIVNAEKVRVTGNKEQGKMYWRHSGYPGGIRSTSVESMRAEHPERMLEIAVKGMLPKNPLGRAMFRKLKVYAGSEHPHAAQQPQVLEL
jgi:large subunit ribosomal protein L13